MCSLNWTISFCIHFNLQQTNTSDMLDLAADYIKDLQRQVKVRVPNCPLLNSAVKKYNIY